MSVQRYHSLFAFMFLLACGSLVWTAGPPRQTAAVAMEGTSFIPPEVTVTLGQTVIWTNKDPFPHNVSSSSGRFSSKNLEPGATWRFTPKTEGRFAYVCTLHPGMKGTLVVKKKSQ
jgi:plastocyanin